MRGSDLVEAMASAVDRIVSARKGACALDRAGLLKLSSAQ
jgi:hypothetical protein